MKNIINKGISAIIKVGISASSAASAATWHEPKRPSKLK